MEEEDKELGEILPPEMKRWRVIYPVYINAKATLQDGRRLAKAKAVDNPSANEIFEACKHLGLPCHLESEKAYSRDWMQKGRVRVRLNGDDGNPIKPDIPNRKVLYVKIAQIIPQLQTRNKAAPKGAPAGGGGKAGRRKKGRS